MTVQSKLVGVAVLAATVASGIELQAQGPKFRESITVQARRGAMGEDALTFSGPVALPGVSLAPGTYIFRHPTTNVVQVADAAGRPYKMFITIPTIRSGSDKGYSIVLGPAGVPDSP